MKSSAGQPINVGPRQSGSWDSARFVSRTIARSHAAVDVCVRLVGAAAMDQCPGLRGTRSECRSRGWCRRLAGWAAERWPSLADRSVGLIPVHVCTKQVESSCTEGCLACGALPADVRERLHRGGGVAVVLGSQDQEVAHAVAEVGAWLLSTGRFTDRAAREASTSPTRPAGNQARSWITRRGDARFGAVPPFAGRR